MATRAEGVFFAAVTTEHSVLSAFGASWFVLRSSGGPYSRPDQASADGTTMSTDWRTDGVRVVPADALDDRTPQTPGMHRAAAVGARTGATGLWAGTVAIEPDARTGAHSHGELESVIYVVSGRARMRWGDRLEFAAEAGPGGFIYVPPHVPHQEENASATEPLHCVVTRTGLEPVVLNLELEGVVDDPEHVRWVDPSHVTGA